MPTLHQRRTLAREVKALSWLPAGYSKFVLLKKLSSKFRASTLPESTVARAPAELLKQADDARLCGDSAKALALYWRAIELEPDKLYALYWAATLLEVQGDPLAAANLCKQGLTIDPDQIGILLRLGSIASAALDPMLALECYERIAKLDPDVPALDALLADQYCTLGRLEEGIAAFDRALVREPDAVHLQSNRLFVLNYTDMLAAPDLFEEHRKWGEQHESRLRSHRRPFGGGRDPDRGLRVGYVSGDFRDHPVAIFIEPWFRLHDKHEFEIHCFDTCQVSEDHVTARLRSLVDAWHRVGDLNDQDLAERIRGSGIDILVDLSGHTKGHRLLTFALRPAPVQVTWLGYLSTTGLTTIDYRMTDEHLDPTGTTEHLHTERLYRIAHHSCFRPAPESPSVGPLPAARAGVVTFGSVNQWSKVTTEVKKVWADVLKTVAGSRLIVVARGGQNPKFRERIVEDFAQLGVRPGQVKVSPALPLQGFLELFAEIDIVLDPFPYGGGTTTMQALWMGAPVVTLRGSTAFSRNSVGPLTAVDLPHLIAASTEEYVTIAAGLARDVPLLQETRLALRERMARSAVMDATDFSRQMDGALRSMWRSYCFNRE
jgi:protein O-GlcNAc transferase